MRLHPLPVATHKHPAVREQAALRSNADLRRALDEEGPFDLVYERYSLWSHAGMDFAQSKGVPGLLEVNAPLIAEQAEHRVLVDRPRAEWVAHRAFGNATALIAVSQEIARYSVAVSQRRGTRSRRPQRCESRPISRRTFSPSYPSAPGAFTVGFVGTLKPWHGLQTLVRAFGWLYAIDPTVRLLVVGEGPQRARSRSGPVRSRLAESRPASRARSTRPKLPACWPRWRPRSHPTRT